jgi:hypothetical protein
VKNEVGIDALPVGERRPWLWVQPATDGWGGPLMKPFLLNVQEPLGPGCWLETWFSLHAVTIKCR